MTGTIDYLYNKYKLDDLSEITVRTSKSGSTMASAHYKGLYPRSAFMNDPIGEFKSSTGE